MASWGVFTIGSFSLNEVFNNTDIPVIFLNSLISCQKKVILSISSIVKFLKFKHALMAFIGKADECLTLSNRSSSTWKITLPSSIKQLDESWEYAVSPKI